MEIIPVKKADMDKLASRVRAGEVFVYPTDTIYGLGCDALNEEAVKRVFETKRRGDKPLSVAFCCIGQMAEYVELGGIQKKVIEAKLPGPYTFVVKNKSIPRAVAAGLDTIGVRIPNYAPLRELIRKAGTPIVTTSANLSGGVAAASLDEIPNEILSRIDFAIDGGRCGSGKPSSVIDLTTGKKLR